ncbi:methyl-accepting chemotaxis protein [Aestuariirhabdus litorea]|uniref:Methyl-accepting chemotaxis protein n=1 Tax=Aestuariirhabdus litorea TaxID=2528527 RepID=A0A3P3VN21_9GAMM|nr:methyl-accepting chemotaxis protein [Aestuariirhabdus litorea]RRJ84095.1 methyl-accepting chemotaxis protein [Aestuariirhabdus litorea]RWW97315.1 methyl-accepting chemotaxis protein [Endozoicomonadaceae bacterium GTF-13]
MNIKQLSIRSVTLGLLCFIGLMCLAATLYVSQNFFQAAVDSQKATLGRVLQVAVEQVQAEVADRSEELAAGLSKHKAVKKAVKAEDGGKLSLLMDDFFSQNLVTAGLVDLAKIRFYSEDGRFIGESAKGLSGLGRDMPLAMKEAFAGREGAERFKLIHATWIAEGENFHSVLTPLGGLKLVGFAEIVLRVSHNLSRVEELVHAPIQIRNLQGRELYRSDRWQQTLEEGHAFDVSYVLPSERGDAGVTLTTLEDNRAFIERARTHEQVGVALTLGVIVLGVLLAIWLLQRYVFAPMTHLQEQMKACTEGDLTLEVVPEGLKDTQDMANSLQQLVSMLRSQVLLINQSAGEVSTSSGHIATVAAQTRAHSDMQKQEMEQSAEAIHEMTSAAQEIARSAQDAETSAHETQQVADEGALVVAESIDMVTQLSEEVNGASGTISQLARDVENIGTILDVIRGVAEQTNLLALNAAIEAARAGEQGRGFAVVADEVRNLAARTQGSTAEIQGMIESLQGGSLEAVNAMNASAERAQRCVEQIDKAGEALKSIKRSTDDISRANTQIASAAEEQSAVTEQINRSVDSVKDAAIDLAAGCTQMSGASGELNEASEQLQKLVARFKV